MPSALVGTVILTLRGRGVGRSELIRRVDWLTRVINKKGGQVAEFHGMSTGVVVDRYVDPVGLKWDKTLTRRLELSKSTRILLASTKSRTCLSQPSTVSTRSSYPIIATKSSISFWRKVSCQMMSAPVHGGVASRFFRDKEKEVS